jgi:hypothetical protein
MAVGKDKKQNSYNRKCCSYSLLHRTVHYALLASHKQTVRRKTNMGKDNCHCENEPNVFEDLISDVSDAVTGGALSDNDND